MRLLSAREVAAMLNVRTARVYALSRARLLPAVRLGRQRRWDEDALRAFVARGGTPAERVPVEENMP